MAVVYSVHIVYSVFVFFYYFNFIVHSFHVFIYNSFCCNVQFLHTGLIKVYSLSSSNNKGLIVNAFFYTYTTRQTAYISETGTVYTE